MPELEHLDALLDGAAEKNFFSREVDDNLRADLLDGALFQYADNVIYSGPDGRYADAISEFIDDLFIACLYSAAQDQGVAKNDFRLVLMMARFIEK